MFETRGGNMESVYEIFAGEKIIIKFEETLLKLSKTSLVYLAYSWESSAALKRKHVLHTDVIDQS